MFGVEPKVLISNGLYLNGYIGIVLSVTAEAKIHRQLQLWTSV